MPDAHEITSIAQLEAVYGQPAGASLWKEIDHVNAEYGAFIEASPFFVLATNGPEGVDCSPSGDAPGFVRVADPKTLMIPDRRGNNRIDSLRNIVRDPRVSLLFLVPGVGETIRVIGRARITTDPALCESFTMEGKVPRCVIVVTIDSCYTQCPKALVRSKLWDPALHVSTKSLPSSGEIMQAISKGEIDGKEYDAAYPQRLKETIY